MKFNNLELLRVFISVAENAGFTRAAGELHRSQSAISMQIKRLEESVGAAVFDRNSKTITLSREGKILLDYAHRILRLVDEAVGAVGKETSIRTVRLGCIEDYAAKLLPKILAGFWAEHPQVQIEVDTGESSDLLKRVGEKYDLVVAMTPAGSGENNVIRSEPLIWATSILQSPHEHVPLPVAMRPAGSLEHQWAAAALDGAGRPWRCAYVSAAVGTLQRAVEEGLAVGVFKASTMTRRLRRLTPEEGFPELPSIDISLHLSDEASAQPMAKLLADCLAKNLGNALQSTD